MAATERLASSLRRLQKPRPNNVHYRCTGDHEINVDEELAKLQPSERLLDYYRAKMTKFDKDNRDMRDLIEKYGQINKPSLTDDERKQMVRELIELRSALSDVNIFIHAERQQVLRLYAEKEQLQLGALEAEKKVALLLNLCGLTEGELKVYLRDPKRVSIIKQKLPPHMRKLQAKLDENLHESASNENELILQSRIQALEKQLKEAEANWLEEKSSLLQERTLASSEYKLQRDKDEAHMKLLSARLEESQMLLNSTMKEVLKKNVEMQEIEKGFLAERDHLLSVLATVQENLPLVTHMEAVQRSGSYSDLTKVKSTCELKDLRRDNEILKNELSKSEELRTLYESQCLKQEQTMCKLREQKEASEQMLKEKIKKLTHEVESLERYVRRSEERRKSDLRGFQSDIQLLRNDLKTLISQLYKITMKIYGDEAVPVNANALKEIQTASDLVRVVQNKLGDVKRKLLKVETEVAVES
ncbi:coiled-coil domain-containing protein 77-like isoform X2 [Macrobrachium nipponense]|uniref:coiled-coil domain-containing protein 77-like isoform X2 n=1 Tax=Macrobrachium nipponense TaxID=159736 RepID=UPI0030C7EDDD